MVIVQKRHRRTKAEMILVRAKTVTEAALSTAEPIVKRTRRTKAEMELARLGASGTSTVLPKEVSVEKNEVLVKEGEIISEVLDEKSDKFTPIAGTNYGLARISAGGGWKGWALAEKLTREKVDVENKRQKTGIFYDSWGPNKYPINFADVARIISDQVSTAQDTKDMLAEIIIERKRLEAVLEKLCEKSLEGKT